MSSNVEILLPSNALNPLSLIMFMLWFTAAVLIMQSKRQQLNYSLIMELNITFLLKSVMNSVTLKGRLTFDWLIL